MNFSSSEIDSDSDSTLMDSMNSTAIFAVTKPTDLLETPWCPPRRRSDIQWALHFYVIPITACQGIATNILSFVILRMMKQVNSANFLLKFVAVLDSLNLVRDAVWPHVMRYIWCVGQSGHPGLLAVSYTMVGTMGITPFWIILVISIDRYAHVCHPLQTRRLRALRLVKIGVTVIVLVTFPLFLTYNCYRYLYNDFIPPKAFGTALAVLGGIVPFPIAACLNILVIVGMRKAQRDVGLKGTIMILTMTIAFLLLKVPMVIASIGNLLHKKIFSNTMLSVALYLDTINYSINFWLYLATGRKFRKTLRTILKPILPRSLRKSFSESFTSSTTKSSRKTSECTKIEQLELQSQK